MKLKLHRTAPIETRDKFGKLIATANMSKSALKKLDRSNRVKAKVSVPAPVKPMPTLTALPKVSEIEPLPSSIQVGDRVMLVKMDKNTVFPNARGTVTSMSRQHGMTVAYVKLDKQNRYGNGHICVQRPVVELYRLEPGQRNKPTLVDDRPEHWSVYQSPMCDDVRTGPVYHL